MNLSNIIALLGGVGMFLYGMKLLGVSLERFAGAHLEKTLERLTNNPVKGLALGAGVTAVIQSSAATSVMAVGFVNAGIMKLGQAVPVVMGANIGTTMTAQILRLGDISSDNLLLTLLKPASFAPLFIALGAFGLLMAKRNKAKDFSSIFIGFGILFVGMTTMENAMSPLRELESFQRVFTLFRNPVLGLLLGLAVTAVLQSSSAAVGLLQATSVTGAITFSTALPILLGMNIGKCITVVLASFGSNIKAKRVVLIDVMCNVFGVGIFLVAMYGWQAVVGFPFWDDLVNRGSIANFHTFFNLATAAILLPCIRLLIDLSGRMLKDTKESKIDIELRLLDPAFLPTPVVALEQCKKVIFGMGATVLENFRLAVDMLETGKDDQLALLEENEKFLDKSETSLGEYLTKITVQHLESEQSQLAAELLHTLGDLERVGDRCINISEVAFYNRDQGIHFSPEARVELASMTNAVTEILECTLRAYREENAQAALNIDPLEQTIDILEETLKRRHIERLQAGQCNVQGGISFVEVLTNLERISDHCSNIAMHLTQRLCPDELDEHSRRNQLHLADTPEYQELFEEYQEKYLEPIVGRSGLI